MQFFDRSRFDVSRVILLCLAGLTLAVFWPLQHFEFLLWDDYEYILNNHHVRSGLSLENLCWAFTTTHASYWHPLTWLSLMADAELFGLNPQGFHFNNLIIHLAGTLLLFATLNGMTGDPWRSGFVAALFSLHPLRIESVAWVAERKDVLGAFFWMLTLFAYYRYVIRPRAWKFFAVLVSFALGLMTKPILVTLPFALLLLDYWPLGRFGSAGLTETNRPIMKQMRFSTLLIEKFPLFILAAVSSLVTFLAARQIGAVPAIEAIPLELRVGNGLVSYVRYISKTLWPTDLIFFYPFPQHPWPFWEVLGSFAVLGCISVLALMYSRRYPYLLMGWFWFLGTLFPVIGFVQVGAQSMADRFTYIPHVGFFVIIAWGTAELLLTTKYRKIFFVLACIGTLLVAASTRSQLFYWKDSVTLFKRAVEKTRDNYMAHYCLGIALSEEGKTEEAIVQFSESHRINPSFVPPLYNLGFIMAQKGRLEEAFGYYSRVLKLTPQDAAAHNNLGNVLLRQGKEEEAAEHFVSALTIDPDFALAQKNLTNLYKQENRIEQPIEHTWESFSH